MAYPGSIKLFFLHMRCVIICRSHVKTSMGLWGNGIACIRYCTSSHNLHTMYIYIIVSTGFILFFGKIFLFSINNYYYIMTFSLQYKTKNKNVYKQKEVTQIHHCSTYIFLQLTLFKSCQRVSQSFLSCTSAGTCSTDICAPRSLSLLTSWSSKEVLRSKLKERRASLTV